MPEPITRTIMEKFDVPDAPMKPWSWLSKMAPHVNSGLHTHPGFDAAYLLEGSLTVLERGQPDKPIRPGELLARSSGFGARSNDAGDQTTKVLAIYVVEKGKPLATPWLPHSN